MPPEDEDKNIACDECGEELNEDGYCDNCDYSDEDTEDN